MFMPRMRWVLAWNYGKLLTSLPHICRWILLGDFNFVDRREDKSSAYGRLIPLVERLVLDALKSHLKVDEPARSLGSLRFSWDNFRLDGSRILAHLDRFYVFSPTAFANRKVTSYQIQGDAAWSNHFLMELTLCLEDGGPRLSRWHMSTQYLDDVN